MRTYEITNVVKTTRGCAMGVLREDGIGIATVKRNSGIRHRAPEFTAKFYTDASFSRFQNFCDSLSISEGLERLMGHD